MVGISLTGVGYTFYIYTNNIAMAETIEELGVYYNELFVDIDKTEIVPDLSENKYNEAVNMYNSVSLTAQDKYKEVQTRLEEQYKNQEDAKLKLNSLYTKGKDYISEDVIISDFEVMYAALDLPFNTSYKEELKIKVDQLRVQFDDIQIALTKLDSLYSNDVLGEFDAVYLNELKLNIDVISNPVIKEAYTERYAKANEEWLKREDEREKERIAAEAEKERLRQEEAQRIEAEKVEAAKKEEERLEAARIEAERLAVQNANNNTNTNTNNYAAPIQAGLGPNQIGIDGTFMSYTSLGYTNDTAYIQNKIDAGLIVSSLSTFSGSDNQTTYFSGHNPGIMNFLASSLGINDTLTVTDANGNATYYKMVERVDSDLYGEAWINSANTSVINLYAVGSYTESIAIQFCNTNNDLVSVWYGIKI